MGIPTLTTNPFSRIIISSSIKMKIVIFFTLLSLSLASDLYVGSWKEDNTQRQNLNDYLYYRGLNWFKRVYVNNANFELTMDIAKEGNTFSISGKKGPKEEPYGFNLVPDNVTRTDADLGALGGPRKATAEFKGNSLVTYLHKPEDDQIDVIAIRTINPATPDVMTYTLRDITSNTDLIQTMNRQ